MHASPSISSQSRKSKGPNWYHCSGSVAGNGDDTHFSLLPMQRARRMYRLRMLHFMSSVAMHACRHAINSPRSCRKRVLPHINIQCSLTRHSQTRVPHNIRRRHACMHACRDAVNSPRSGREHVVPCIDIPCSWTRQSRTRVPHIVKRRHA